MKKIVLLIVLISKVVPAWCQNFSYLRIELRTANAEVYLDKIKIPESTLLNWMTITSGRHTIRATIQGYYPYINSFILGDGERKTINVILEKDLSSDVIITSNSTNTQLEIDNKSIDWISSGPLKMTMKPSNYEFSFSEIGKKQAKSNISIYEVSLIEIKVDLEPSYPQVLPEEVGRSFMPSYDGKDLYKTETKIEYNSKRQWITGSVVGLLTTIVLIATAPGGGDHPGAAVVLGFCVGSAAGALTKPKPFEVPDNEGIIYNRETVPGLIREKNLEIEKYNTETQLMIEKKQEEKYNETTISVSQTKKE